MTKQQEKEKITLVRLYNRLSYYFCSSKQPMIKIDEYTTIDDLQHRLDELYEKEQKEEQSKPKIKFGHKNG